MKYIFFGTPEFAAIILEKLIKAGEPPLAVVTNPDRPAGRQRIITSPPVKKLAQGICDVLQPEAFNASFAQKIEGYGADFFVVAAYGKILPKWLIEMPPKKTIGVHPSLLPKYRGASPVQSVLLSGEAKTGTTLFLLDEKMDNGLILAKTKLTISNEDNYTSLIKKLADLSADLILETLPKYLSGSVVPRPQDDSQASYTKKITAEDAFVDLGKDNPETIWKKTKALNPEPGVWTMDNGRRMKILEAGLIAGELKIIKIQFEGERPKNTIF